MSGHLFRRSGEVAIPAFKDDQEWLHTLRDGALISVRDGAAPSAKLRKFYWALLGKVVDTHDYYTDAEALHDYLRTAVQFVSVSFDHEMRAIISLRSTSDAKCSFSEFKDYCDKAFKVVVERVMPGMKLGVLIREVESMLGMSFADAKRGNRGRDTGEMYDGE